MQMAMPMLVKRYGRTRLYDAENVRYVSIDQVRTWVDQGVTVIVQEAETGVDITRMLLA